jgi:hypothetical protein
MESLLSAVDGQPEPNNDSDRNSIDTSSVTASYSSHEPAERKVYSSISNVAKQNNLHAQKIPEEDLDLARFESVRFLGDLSGIKFLSKSFQLDKPFTKFMPGHHVERLGKDTFLCAAEKMPNSEIAENMENYETRADWVRHIVGLDLSSCDRLMSL